MSFYGYKLAKELVSKEEVEGFIKLEEFQFDIKESKFLISFKLNYLGKEAGFISFEIPITPKLIRWLLEDLSEIIKELSAVRAAVVKEVKPHGTGAIVYVPKSWVGKEVVVGVVRK